MKHTKGTWKCLGKMIISEVIDSEGEERLVEIANLTSQRGHGGPETVEEYRDNGFLIAAAPDLFESLKNILELIESNYLVRNIQDDGHPDFAMRQVEPIMKLKKAFETIKKAERKWD